MLKNVLMMSNQRMVTVTPVYFELKTCGYTCKKLYLKKSNTILTCLKNDEDNVESFKKYLRLCILFIQKNHL